MKIGSSTYNHLGEYLLEKRREVGLSQTDAARALGYSERRFLSLIENNRVSLPFQAVPVLADLYNIPLTELTEAIIEEQIRITKEKVLKAVNDYTPNNLRTLPRKK